MKFSFLTMVGFGVIALIGEPALSATLNVAKSGGTYTTIQAGVTAANAGDTVLVQPGTYNEAVSFGKSGSATGSITLKGVAGAIIDGTGKGQTGIAINSRNYIKVIGMEVQNFKGSGTPIGISVEGTSSYLEIRNNKVHNIENANGNAHGIAFYGSSATPISNLIVDGNEIYSCLLGQSESMVLNGNVTLFSVTNNVVHDNDNIGIDFIGFEGTGPAGSDQARSGVCSGNHVYNISSGSNPTYGGERSADGIYVDGGKDIIIERNTIDNCDIGIEIASEHGGKTTSGITVRSNFVSRSYQGNIMAGGYGASRGNASAIVIVNNTLYHGRDGEVLLQFNCSDITIKNNICVANSGTAYVSSSGSNNTAITVDNNMYYGASTSSSGDWSDSHAKYANPLLVNAPTDMHVQATSPAKNAGTALAADIGGSLDIDGQTRVQESAVDIGADELGATELTAPTAPSLALSSPSNGATAQSTMPTLSWGTSSGATSYRCQVSTSSAFSSTIYDQSNLTSTSASVSGLTGGTTYYWRVSATNSAGTSSWSTISSFTTASGSSSKLNGTTFGTSPAYNNGTSTYDKAYDANTSTFFDYANANGGYTGIDLGSGTSRTITQIKYYPRSGFSGRMIGGKFQGSNTSSSSGYTDLYTISSTPTEGQWTTQIVSNINSYRYLRYLGPSTSYANVAEIEFWGVSGSSGGGSTWTGGDIGAVAAAGSWSLSGSTYTVKGSGADIWNTADEFYFVYQQITGNKEIIARVASQTNSNVWAKAGVMIRETLGANARNAIMVTTPSNGNVFQRRTTVGGSSSSTAGRISKAPTWVRLVRNSTTITAYDSQDGVTWATIGSVSIAMTSTVYIGLAVTSHADGTISTATFDNVIVR